MLLPLSVKPSKVKLDKPKPYDSTKGALYRFLTKLWAHFLHYKDDFSYKFTKVIFASNCLTSNTLDWFEPTLRDYLDHTNTPKQQEEETKKIFSKYKEFETAIKEAFGDPNKERNSERQLTALKQTKSVSAYAARFRQLVSKLN